jgi:hypothetical protein
MPRTSLPSVRVNLKHHWRSHPRRSPQCSTSHHPSALHDYRLPPPSALKYLAESCAAPINVGSTGSIHVGKAPSGVATFWASCPDLAEAICLIARRLVDKPDVATATAALHTAARKMGSRLTPNNVAVDRAESAARKIDALMEKMRTSGTLKIFNDEFRQRRLAAFRNGAPYTPYQAALTRLRRELVQILKAGGKIDIVAAKGLFARVFDGAKEKGSVSV